MGVHSDVIVSTDATLTGSGTVADPLSVVPGGSTTVTTAAPITGTGTALDPVTMAAATDSVDGYLTKEDHAALSTAVAGSNPWGVHKINQALADAAISIDENSQRVVFEADSIAGAESLLGKDYVFAPTKVPLWGMEWEISVTGAVAATIGAMHKCSGTAADYAVTLPLARLYPGRVLGFRMMPGLTKMVTITASGADLIDGLATRIMWANEVAVLYSDGITWTKIAGKSMPMSATIIMIANQIFANSTWTTLAYDAIFTANCPGNLMADYANKRLLSLRPARWSISARTVWVDTTSARTRWLLLYGGGTLWAAASTTTPANTRHSMETNFPAAYMAAAAVVTASVFYDGTNLATASLLGGTSLGAPGTTLSAVESVIW
jgi:hypothetical protein